MKYPIGCQTFSTIIEQGMSYVDKTDLIYEVAQKHICFFSRPRRFGKSLMLSTLKSYFLGKKELFKGLKMEQLENDWKVYPVLHLDFAQGDYKQSDYFNALMANYLEKWESEYNVSNISDKIGIRFSNVINAAHIKTGQKVVILIDEYDKPLLDVLGESVEQKNRDMLKELYSAFKFTDESLQFVMLTGVTKFSQVSVFSGFNQPEDISLDNRFDALCGITEDELHVYFDEGMAMVAEEYGMSKEQMFQIFKKRYDGYHFSGKMRDVYNPFSVLNALSQRRLDDYWFASGTPTYLMKLIQRNSVNIQQLLGTWYRKQMFMDYKADIEQPLPMLYQSGYLTIKGYNVRREEFALGFPNHEVQRGFMDMLANDYLKTRNAPTSFVLDIADMLDECRLDDMRDAFTAFFADIPYGANQQEKAADYESHYHYTLFIIFRLLSCYTTFTEKQNSRGRADIIVETDSYVYIFEFKLDGSAQEALDQIEQQGYAEPYLADKRQLIKVGVSFSSEKKNIVEWKVI